MMIKNTLLKCLCQFFVLSYVCFASAPREAEDEWLVVEHKGLVDPTCANFLQDPATTDTKNAGQEGLPPALEGEGGKGKAFTAAASRSFDDLFDDPNAREILGATAAPQSGTSVVASGAAPLGKNDEKSTRNLAEALFSEADKAQEAGASKPAGVGGPAAAIVQAQPMNQGEGLPPHVRMVFPEAYYLWRAYPPIWGQYPLCGSIAASRYYANLYDLPGRTTSVVPFERAPEGRALEATIPKATTSGAAAVDDDEAEVPCLTIDELIAEGFTEFAEGLGNTAKGVVALFDIENW